MQRWLEVLEEALPEPWMQAMAILLLAGALAVVLRLVLTVSLVRWATRSPTDLDDQLAQALRRPLCLSVLLIGIAAAAVALRMPEAAERLVLRSTATVAVLMWMLAGFRVCFLLVRVFARFADRVSWIQPSTVPLVENLLRVGLVVVAAYLLLKAWQLDVTPWLASAGVLGIALGFAAKDTLANLFGGFFIIIDAPYRIGVAYGSELDQVRQALLQAAEIVPFCLNDPEPRVRPRAFGDSSLDYELLVWIERPELRGRCIDALLSDLYVRFRELGVEIPFPQRDVHLRHLPDPGGTEPKP